MKAKKQASSNTDGAIKKPEHKVQALMEERAGAGHIIMTMNLDKQYEWIMEGSQ